MASLIHFTLSHQAPSPLVIDTLASVSACWFLFGLAYSFYILLFIFHIWLKSWSVHFSPSDLWFFPGGSVVKTLSTSEEDSGSISGFGKIPWKRKWQSTPVILAWRIPWTEETSGPQSMGSQENEIRLSHYKHRHLSYFSYHNAFKVLPYFCKLQDFIFSWLSSIPLYTDIPHFFYPFICWWTLRLFPCLG